MIPSKHILDDRFWKDNLPDFCFSRIGDVNDHIEGMNLFMSVVIWIRPDLLLQWYILGLMIDDINGCYRIQEILRKIQHALSVHGVI